MKVLFGLLFLIAGLPFILTAQQIPSQPDIIGLWKGYIGTSEKQLPYEIVITEVNGKLTGYSYTTFLVQGREIVSMKKIEVIIKKNEIITEDEEMLYDNFIEDAPKKIKQVNSLELTGNKSKLLLTGKFETKAPKTMRRAVGIVYLEKKVTNTDTKLLAKLEDLNLASSLSFRLPDSIPALNEDLAKNDPPAKTGIITQQETTSVKTTEVPAKTIAVAEKPVQQSEKNSTPAETKLAVVIPIVEEAYILPANAMMAKVSPIVKQPVRSPYVASIRKPLIVIKPGISKPVGIFEKAADIAAAKAEKARVAKQTAANVPAGNSEIAKTIVAEKPANKIMPVNVIVAPDLDIARRTIETIDQLFITSDSLQFTLYDNGEVDGDTVSILLNGKTIVYRQGLSTTAFTKTVYITPDLGDSIQLIMYAENLGSIAPNTGLLVLLYDNKRREIRFSGDLNKNAAITLRRRR